MPERVEQAQLLALEPPETPFAWKELDWKALCFPVTQLSRLAI
jgi:hypothetical protein